MNYTLKPHTVIAHMVPGVFFLMAVSAIVIITDPTRIHPIEEQFSNSTILLSALALVAVLFVALFCGLSFDAIRNLFEVLWDRWSDHDPKGRCWDFFFEGKEEKVEQLINHYYSYYVLDANLVIASAFVVGITAFLLQLWQLESWRTWWCALPVVLLLGLIFLFDARNLRKDIKRLVLKHLGNDDEELPHQGVYTRLGASDIHGVGVFAIKDIKKNTPIFGNDDEDLVWIEKEKLVGLPVEIQRLYDDFAVIKNGKYGCPQNFNRLTVSWYLNQPNASDEPNVRCSEEYEFFARRDIKKEEELTVLYRTYSESPT